MPYRHHGGRQELGQNFLTDHAVIADICAAVSGTRGPIVEIGAGDGALTVPLSHTGRPVTAVEVDPRRARRLARRTGSGVTVVNDDILRYRFPREPHTLVGNIPFHITTATLRRVFPEPHWHTAVLVTQWEAARRRAGVGGGSQLTAAWWPWYDFAVLRRVPAGAFRPVPSVDGAVLTITRRRTPLVSERERYQRFVRQVFSGPGRDVADIVLRTGRLRRPAVSAWMARHRVRPAALPKDLTAEQWAALWREVREVPGPRGGPPRSVARAVPDTGRRNVPGRRRGGAGPRRGG